MMFCQACLTCAVHILIQCDCPHAPLCTQEALHMHELAYLLPAKHAPPMAGGHG